MVGRNCEFHPYLPSKLGRTKFNGEVIEMRHNKTVRAGAGDITIFDMELMGKWRRVAVTREAIEDYLRLSPAEAAKLRPEDCVKFVEDHRPVIMRAAESKVRNGHATADVIMIMTGEIAVGEVASSP